MGFDLGKGLVTGTIAGLATGGIGAIPGILAGGFLGGGSGGGFNGGPAIPSFAMRKTTDFNQDNPNIQIGGPNGAGAMAKRFNSLRDQANNQSNAASGQASDAIKRRFASMGAGNSGAQIKMEQQALDRNEEQRSATQANINNQETEAGANRDSAQASLDFQNRVFSFNQASKMHELDLSERQQKIDSVTGEYNKNLSTYEAQKPQGGLISNVLGGLL